MIHVNPKAHRLIYINNLEGQLYYCWKDEYYVLSIKDRQVVLSKFYKTDNEYIYIKSSEHIYNNEQKKDSKFRQHKDLEAILKNNFFYTLVSNYSLYAYNTQDYKFENKVDNKLLESDCWLKGIFHKNDGYQTPLVLTPYREDGCIDINKENRLSKDRLISAMIMPKSEYRIINGHLEAYSFSLLNKERCINAKYLKQKVGFKNLYERGFEALKDMIIEQWEECIKIKFKDYEYRKHYNEALQYIVYKTLKISSTYKVYIAFFQANKDIAYKIKDYEKLKELVYNLSIDTSHITKKIRQTISYILFGLYDNDNNIYDINKLSNKASDYIEIANEKYSLDGKAYWSIDDFIPPPFFKVVINLRDIISKDKVLFETLSSGERQQAYSVSSLLYHLGNLNSAKNSPNRLAYNKVNIILEEIELYFHPELQRTLLKYIIDEIGRAHV